MGAYTHTHTHTGECNKVEIEGQNYKYGLKTIVEKDRSFLMQKTDDLKTGTTLVGAYCTRPQSNKGITLIALVVTIIVLIILAAVSLNLLLGENGIIGRAQQASRETKLAAFKEKLEMEIAEIVTDLLLDGKEPNLTNVEEKLDELGYHVTPEDDGTLTVETDDGGKATVHPDLTVEVEGAPNQNGGETPTPPPKPPSTSIGPGDTAEGNQKYIDANEEVAVIPDGFTIADEPGEGTIDEGLVVKGPDGSEFVWIPVPEPVLDVQGMNDTQINEAIQAEVSVGRYPMAIKVTSSDYKGILYSFSTSGYPDPIKNIEYRSSSSSQREPDVVTGVDNQASYYSAAGITGITNASQFKTQLQSEYNDMILSVQAKGGFYIGRYETSLQSSSVVSKAGVTPMNYSSWYLLYQKQKEYPGAVGTEGVSSAMIYNSAWDQAMIALRNVPNRSAWNKSFIAESVNMGWYKPDSRRFYQIYRVVACR